MLTRTNMAGMILATAAILLASLPVKTQEPQHRVIDGHPVTGKASPGTEALDKAVVTILNRHGIPGAALAIARDGKLIIARGYGWANLASREIVRPDTMFGVASLSKTLTATAVLKLVEQGKLKLEDHPFKILSHIKPRNGANADPRLYQVTVRQLLNHSGGWDATKSGDPVNWATKMQYEYGERTPISAEYIISAMISNRLDFDPGTVSKYSNFGYIVLGELIVKVSGQTYEKYVKEHITIPAGAHSANLHQHNPAYFKNEARRYLAGVDTELPPFNQKFAESAGGWTISAIDMVRFLTALDGSRGKPLLDKTTFQQMIALPPPPLAPRENGTHVGLGWDNVLLTDKSYACAKDGNWYGMRAFMKRAVDGTNWALLMNASMQPDSEDTKTVRDVVQDLRKHIDQIERFEESHDLFKDYP